MRTDKIPVVIMSAFERNNTDDVNNEKHDKLKEVLKNLDYTFKEVDGVYNGYEEKSLVINASKSFAITMLLGVATRFNQESILYVNNERIAALYFINGQPEVLGKFESISEEVAKGLNSYTIDEKGYYYGVV